MARRSTEGVQTVYIGSLYPGVEADGLHNYTPLQGQECCVIRHGNVGGPDDTAGRMVTASNSATPAQLALAELTDIK